MVERWRPDVTYVTGECFPGMIRDSQGEYVEYDDYARLKEALRGCVEGYDKSMLYVADPENPFTAAIAKAREVLGDD